MRAQLIAHAVIRCFRFCRVPWCFLFIVIVNFEISRHLILFLSFWKLIKDSAQAKGRRLHDERYLFSIFYFHWIFIIIANEVTSLMLWVKWRGNGKIRKQRWICHPFVFVYFSHVSTQQRGHYWIIHQWLHASQGSYEVRLLFCIGSTRSSCPIIWNNYMLSNIVLIRWFQVDMLGGRNNTPPSCIQWTILVTKSGNLTPAVPI